MDFLKTHRAYRLLLIAYGLSILGILSLIRVVT